MSSALNGKGGAQLGEHVGFHFSRMTFLRSLHLLPTPAVDKVRVVGLDDFAWKRGSRYGTIILDLETHTLLDVLPNRDAESVKTWLAAHPEIEFVSRDRAGAYADGAARGARQAQQIADRWHLAKNLGDAVEDYLKRKRIRIPDVEPAEQQPWLNQGASVESAHPIAERTRKVQLAEQEKDQRQELWGQASTRTA
jgi:transposase